MMKFILVLGIVFAIIPLASEALLPGESIVRDPNTGDYIITYANAVGRLKQSRFVPSTKIDPTLRSRFENQRGLIRYRYAIKNGSGSKQPLIGLTFDPVSNLWTRTALPKTGQEQTQAYIQNAANPTQLAQMVIENTRIVEAPSGWSCDVMPAGEMEWAGYRIACSFDDLDENKRNGLQAGNTLAGFGFYSMDLPGVGTGQLRGFGDMGPGFVDEGPDGEISDQLEAIQKNDYVSRNAAVSTIAVPNPFDAAVLLDRIRTHVATWPGKQLIDAAFAAQVDRYMAAAADAYRLNQTKIGKENIKAIRKLLEHEHKYLDHDDEDNDDTDERKAVTRLTIDRLAARVLDFDLRYVLKRTEPEEGERKTGGD